YGRPFLIFITPLGAGREPHRKGLGKIFIWMLLGIPAFHVANEAAGESDRTIIVAIVPAIGAEEPLPFRGFIKPVSVINGVTGLMAKIHHALVRVFQIVYL